MTPMPPQNDRLAVTPAKGLSLYGQRSSSLNAHWAEPLTLPSYAVTSWCSGRSSALPYPPTGAHSIAQASPALSSIDDRR